MPGTLGVLLAGGAGSRLALGVPKALVPLGGVTLLARGVAILAAVCEEVVVTAPAALEPALAGTLGGMGETRARFRTDGPTARAGPLAGLVAGLTAAPFERAVVLAVDLPFVPPALLETLLARLGAHHAVIPVPGGFPQPLAAAYAPEAAAILARCLAAGEHAPTRALGSLDALRLDDETLAGLPGGVDGFFNLNTRDDLAAAERRLSAREARR